MIISNFECGFYSILTTEMRWSFNYFLIIIHFLIFEQELILALLLIFGLNAFNSNNLLWILLVILFIDLLFVFSINYWGYDALLEFLFMLSKDWLENVVFIDVTFYLILVSSFVILNSIDYLRRRILSYSSL